MDWNKAFVVPSLITNRNFIQSLQIILKPRSRKMTNHMLKMAKVWNRHATKEHIQKENTT